MQAKINLLLDRLDCLREVVEKDQRDLKERLKRASHLAVAR
jgi:hypothetical protein